MNTPRNDKITHITPQDLPLYCYGSGIEDRWNGHPRVFLPIRPNSDYCCPYCGRRYHLDGIPHTHHSPA